MESRKAATVKLFRQVSESKAASGGSQRSQANSAAPGWRSDWGAEENVFRMPVAEAISKPKPQTSPAFQRLAFPCSYGIHTTSSKRRRAAFVCRE